MIRMPTKESPLTLADPEGRIGAKPSLPVKERIEVRGA
jgi:hypothetical protein